MALIKVKEVIGTSPNSFEEAIKEAIETLSKERKNLTGIKIVGWTIDVEDGKISQYKVNLKYAYRWEKELQE